MQFKSARVLALVAGLVVPALAANADISRTFRVVCEQPAYVDDLGRDVAAYFGVYDFDLDTPGQWAPAMVNGTMGWRLLQPWDFLDNDSGAVRASITSLEFSFIEDPVINFNAGFASGGVATAFALESPLLSFPTLVNPTVGARASVSVAITDSAVGGFGGSLSPDLFGGSIFRTAYNGVVDPVYDGATFEDILAGGAYNGAANFNADTSAFPVFGPIAGNVSNMQSGFSFTLSRFDLASFTSTYEIIGQVPTPGAGSLLALGGLALVRRRRSR